MNSVFNLASYNLNTMTDDELIAWIRAEGPTHMPPIIRTLVERLARRSRLSMPARNQRSNWYLGKKGLTQTLRILPSIFKKPSTNLTVISKISRKKLAQLSTDWNYLSLAFSEMAKLFAKKP